MPTAQKQFHSRQKVYSWSFIAGCVIPQSQTNDILKLGPSKACIPIFELKLTHKLFLLTKAHYFQLYSNRFLASWTAMHLSTCYRRTSLDPESNVLTVLLKQINCEDFTQLSLFWHWNCWIQQMNPLPGRRGGKDDVLPSHHPVSIPSSTSHSLSNSCTAMLCVMGVDLNLSSEHPAPLLWHKITSIWAPRYLHSGTSRSRGRKRGC